VKKLEATVIDLEKVIAALRLRIDILETDSGSSSCSLADYDEVSLETAKICSLAQEEDFTVLPNTPGLHDFEQDLTQLQSIAEFYARANEAEFSALIEVDTKRDEFDESMATLDVDYFCYQQLAANTQRDDQVDGPDVPNLHGHNDFDPFAIADYYALAKQEEWDSLAHPLPTVKEKRNLLRTFKEAVASVSNDSVTLGMWHNHWQSKPYGCGLGVNNSRVIPSVVYPDKRWEITKGEGGGDYYLTAVPTQHPERGGASDSADFGYAPEETRPFKRLEVAEFMDVRALPYVDFELFIHLKEFTMQTGVTSVTQPKLYRQAKTFLGQYRVNHLPPELLLEVEHWTVLASMIPTKSEILGMKMMAKPKLFDQMYKTARFRRDGMLREVKPWWKIGKTKLLGMYKPVVV